MVPPFHTDGLSKYPGGHCKVPSWFLVAEPFHDPLACKAPKTIAQKKRFHPQVRRALPRGSKTEPVDVSSSGESRATRLKRLLQVPVTCMWTQLCVRRRKSGIFLTMSWHYNFFNMRNWNISVQVKNKQTKNAISFEPTFIKHLIPSGGFERVRWNSTVARLSCFC